MTQISIHFGGGPTHPLANASGPPFPPPPTSVEPSGPNDPTTQVGPCIPLGSTERTIIGLDTGERAGKTVACYPDGSTRHYADPLAALAEMPSGARVIVERSVYAFRSQSRAAFIATAKLRGLELYPIDPRRTMCRRRDWHPGVEKTDELDALVLRDIGIEGVIPRCPLSEPRLAPDLLTRARQVGYDLDHPELPARLREAVERITSQPVPPCAVLAGVALPAGKRSAVRWAKVGYQLVTFAVLALESGSKKKAKNALKHPGLARSNLRHHPLRTCESVGERREIMRSMDRFQKWTYDLLHGPPRPTAQSTVAHTSPCSGSLILEAA
jgi:hypothetical protein